MNIQGKNVLLIAPVFLGIYQDIISGFEDLGMNVDFIPDYILQRSPYNRRRSWYFPAIRKNKCQRMMKEYWTSKLSQEDFSKKYDILFVVDGQGLHHCLFEILKQRNPKIYSVNYLFDTTRGVYEFQHMFHYFNKVATFDLQESRQYGIELLPIFWAPVQESDKDKEYDLFAFASYHRWSYDIFEHIRNLCNEIGLNSYVKLYYNRRIKNEKIYSFRKSLQRRLLNDQDVTIQEYHSDIITLSPLSTVEFRKYIKSSKVILDVNAPYQDGLTARFMWSLGQGKKIITTNQHALSYPFYNKEQIMLYKHGETTDEDLKTFMSGEFIMTPQEKEMINSYRLDNWIKYLLDIK